MSDVSRGAGWWQASDGKWYPPESHPNYQPQPPPPAPAAAQPPPGPGPQPWAAGAVPPQATGRPAFAFDVKRWSQTDRITVIATLVLFISLFLPWFTYNYGFGSLSVNGYWHGWMYLVAIISLALLAYFVLTAGYDELPFNLPMTPQQLLLIATGVNAVLTLIAFLLKPGGIELHGIGWGIGAFIGLAAAIVAVVPHASPVLKGRSKA